MNYWMLCQDDVTGHSGKRKRMMVSEVLRAPANRKSR